MPLTRTQKLRKLRARARKAATYEQIAWSRSAPIVAGQVLYESFSGNGMLDNPEALFRELRQAPDLAHLTHVWVLSDLETYRDTVNRFRSDPRVRFVKYRSPGYFAALSRSQYLVNNATFPPEFAKREGQVYVNTWHGTPMKHMGYDIPGGGPAARNVVRNFVSADYLLSANEFTTERMYKNAYRMTGIFRGKIIQEGSPRADHQQLDDVARSALRSALVGRGVQLDPAEKIVLYAPTWRGSFYSPTNDAMQLLARVQALQARLQGSGFRVLLKVHQVVYEFAAQQPGLRAVLVPNDLVTNAVLGVTDVLVTDYSSIFVEYLATGRPVLFHLPDQAGYADSRGLYVQPEDWPGPLSEDVEQLADQIRQLKSGTADDPVVRYAATYADFAERFCSKEDGGAARRVVDIVWRGHTDGYDICEDFDDGRESILIYLGGMRSNGITTSVLSLLDNIDYERFDVSACYTYSRARDRRRNEASIHPHVRLFPRFGGMNGSKLFRRGRKAMLTRGVEGAPALQRDMQRQLFRDEWSRCFGMSRFDHIVDFSGYGPFWDYVLLQGQAKTRSIWLHNDLAADSQREVDGKRRLEAGLTSVFSTYKYFDTLVSVSSALAEINREHLGQYGQPDQFVSARNTLNFRRILRMAHGTTIEDHPLPQPAELDLVHADQPAPPQSDLVTIHPHDLPGSMDALMHFHPLASILEEVRRKETIVQLVPPQPGVTTFVSVGRLSPEKNHERLLRAFDLVHRDNPRTRLVIIGGGPLRSELRALVADLGLVTAVTLAGARANPYAVMAASDCFVLSSNYEGQPMVLLEAMVLGLPIVTTRFDSVAGAVPDGHGLIVDQSVPGLAEGMLAFLRGEVPYRPYDYVKANDDAMEEFYRAIGASTPSSAGGAPGTPPGAGDGDGVGTAQQHRSTGVGQHR